ncbi:MAG: hypothetical protein E3K37_03405 [Candidatus Kuenenia sp.]|nr:hypothetical protein [Candidatus Kuenenia hertensis]
MILYLFSEIIIDQVETGFKPVSTKGGIQGMRVKISDLWSGMDCTDA